MNLDCVIDNALLTKYPPVIGNGDIYPIMQDFKGGFFREEVEKAIRSSINDSLDLVLNFPSYGTARLGATLNLNSRSTREFAIDYVDDIILEMVSKAQMFKCYHIASLYFCGELCSLLPASQLIRLKNTVQDYFKLDSDVKIEVDIKPHSFTFDDIAMLKRAGFSQINYLVHHTNHNELEAIHLSDNTFDIRELIVSSTNLGFDVVSINLTYGLPCQSLDVFCQTLDNIKALNVDHINFKPCLGIPLVLAPAYNLDKHCAHHSSHCRNQLIMTAQILGRHGYHMLAPGYFVKPNDPLAKAQFESQLQLGLNGFCVDKHVDLLGIGAAALSSISNMYSQNAMSIENYRQMLGHFGDAVEYGCVMNEDQLLRRHVIKELICNLCVDKIALYDTFDIEFDEYFKPELAQISTFITDELVLSTPYQLSITPKARLLIQNICQVFCHKI